MASGTNLYRFGGAGNANHAGYFVEAGVLGKKLDANEIEALLMLILAKKMNPPPVPPPTPPSESIAPSLTPLLRVHLRIRLPRLPRVLHRLRLRFYNWDFEDGTMMGFELVSGKCGSQPLKYENPTDNRWANASASKGDYFFQFVHTQR